MSTAQPFSLAAHSRESWRKVMGRCRLWPCLVAGVIVLSAANVLVATCQQSTGCYDTFDISCEEAECIPDHPNAVYGPCGELACNNEGCPAAFSVVIRNTTISRACDCNGGITCSKDYEISTDENGDPYTTVCADVTECIGCFGPAPGMCHDSFVDPPTQWICNNTYASGGFYCE